MVADATTRPAWFARWRSAALLGSLLLAQLARAATPAGYAEYIVPFDEDVFVFVTDPVITGAPIGPNNTTFTLISVTTWSDTVTIYLDHWENGYGYDANNPDGPGTDEKYTLNAGQTLNFSSPAVPRPRTGADGNTYVGAAGNCTAQPTPAVPLIHLTLDFCYDGRDRIVTVGGATTVTRGGYLNAPGPGKLAAIGEEVYPLAPQLIRYILPFGEDAGIGPPARADFQRVLVLIQATEDNTLIQIDFNGDGVFDPFNTENGYRTARVDPVDSTTVALQRGQAYVLDRDSDGIGGTLNKGTVILGTETLQVEYFYGQTNSNFNTRAVSAYPRGFWTNEYYASADGAATINTDVLLYNPNSFAITINWETTAGAGNFTMVANETAFLQARTGSYVPNGSGVYLQGTGTFWGTSDVDTNGINWDWGYSLVPSYLLSDDQTVAWAPGNSPALACNAANGRGNGLFVTPALDNTTFFIDTSGDGLPDTDPSIEVLRGATPVAPTGSGYRADRLDSLYITGSNSGILATSICDLTGARVYASGPFSMSYGENPDKASVAGGLDLGYTVLPSPSNWMDLALSVSKATNPVLVSTVAGATTVTYTLAVQSHLFNIDSLSVVDTLPANWTFDNDSAVITLPNLTQISGPAANPVASLPTLTWGPGLLGSMLPNQQITITFTARTTAAFANGAITQNGVQAVGTRTVGGVTQTFRASDFVLNTYTDGSVDMQLTKASSVPLPTPVSPGDPLTYTVTVTNPATATTTLTGVTVYDPIPTGVTYVAASGSVTCELLRNVRDQFDNPAYTGSNGTNPWATNWVETDAYGTFANGAGAAAGAAGGYVAVTGGALQFRYLLSTVRDNFDTNNVFTGNNGSNAWTTPWTENNDDNNANGGDIRINNNRIEFRDTTDGGTIVTGEAIRRSATVTNATSLTVQLDWDAFGGLGANDDLIVEWSLDGTAWNTLRTLDGGVPDGTYTNTIAWTPTDTTFILRFRAEDAIEAGEQARIDRVQVGFDVPANAVGAQVVRTANLAGALAPALTLTTTSAGLAAGDNVVLEAATSTAGPFTALATSTGNIGAGAFVPVGPYDLSPYASATTAIRLRVTGGYDATTKALNVDNVNIDYGVASTFAAALPPAFVPRSIGCRIRPNNSMTVTFNVIADNPFPVNQNEIVNVVTTGANELPVPLQATVRNIVLVPGGLSASVGDRVWLDADADGVFDPGETGLAGVELTLKDQFGTPLQISTTDSQGRYTFIDVAPGSGYFVEITGGLPSGLTQTTDTVGDAFDVNGVFTGNNGTLNWLTNWTESNDDANAAAGDIQIANNRIEFRDTTDGGTLVTGESIQRRATVTGATSLELQYSWDSLGLETNNTDNIIVESSIDGTTWTTARTLNGDASGTFTDTIPWVPSNNTAFVRFRAEDAIEGGEQARIDNVQLRFPQNLRTANFNLAAGQDYVRADLGYRASAGTATIGDLVWVDANNDQVRNPGEVGLAGITVDLYADTDGDGLPNGGPIASTVTGPGGAYLFTGIPADGVLDYVVTMNTGQAPLSGYSATTQTLFSYANLPSGAVRTDADFGFQNPSASFTIADGVWLDNGLPSGTANNGVKDGTEVGIGGVTVDLLDSAGNTIASTTSAANGSFQFTGVPGGRNYSWRITDNAGVLADYFGTTPSALSGNFQMVGSLTTNLDFTANPHFGYNQTRSIGDTVWNDLDNNQVQNAGEPGIGGVTVLLYLNDGDGVFEPGAGDGNPIATQVTDVNGQYLFAGLAAGTYWVSIDSAQSALSGYSLTTTDGSGVAGHQLIVTPALAGGANRLDIDFGYRAATPFAISGRFFSDINRNGVDNTETGFQGVTVELMNLSGVVVGATSTAADGSYSFPGLPAGTYTVRVTDTSDVLSGYETTFERTEGGLAPSYNSREVVTLGPSVTDVNFGYYRGNSVVTRAVISSFVARDVAGALALEWTTASEIGTIGFALERWDDEQQAYVAVNERLLPALITAPQGGLYRYIDPRAVPGQPYRYRIVEVEAKGGRLTYGPYDVSTLETASGADEDAKANAVIDDAVLRAEGYSRTPHAEPAEARLARSAQARAPVLESVAPAAKLGVKTNGLHYVSNQDLQTQGGIVAPETLSSLTSRGKPVAFARTADQNGILFYGRATQSNVERDNVYRLSSDAPSVLMQTRQNPSAPPPTGAEQYIGHLHVEQDAIAANTVHSDPDGDFWVWDYVYAGFGAKPFVFRTDGAAGTGQVSITIRLKGGTDLEADPDHHATFKLNGTPIGEAFWNGTEALQTTVAFDGSLLVDGENTLTVDGLLDTQPPDGYSLFYVDSFDVNYTSYYRAHGNTFLGPASGHDAVLISGFTRPDVAVFDVTIPTRPEIVQAPVSLLGDGTYGVVVASNNRQALYHALTPDAFSSAARIVPDLPSALRQPDTHGAYLVITTAALKATAQTLADYRSDLPSKVVDIEDVYDEFNYGTPSPYALRAFLAYARSNWATPARYVVLAGDGSYDYKNVMGFSDNLIPPMVANTPDGLFPSDAWFVAGKASLAELAIGRLPVTSTAQMQGVIAKIQTREGALAEAWVQSVLLVADDPDAGGNFPLSSEGLVGLVPPEVSLARAYISVAGAAGARTQLLDGINQGAGVVSYVGHAGFVQLADENLLTAADVGTLVNSERPTLITAMTCLAGSSGLPGYSTLGELLVRQPAAGAAAVLAPSGMSESEFAEPFAQAFYAALFTGRGDRLGDAVRTARRVYLSNASRPSYIPSIYNLLGDPAMRVR